MKRVSSAEQSYHACNQLHVPPRIMSSVSGSSAHNSVSCSVSLAPCPIMCHTHEQQPHYQHAHPSTSEVIRRLQSLQKLGCLWSCADESWSESAGIHSADANACLQTQVEQRLGSTHGSSGNKSVVYLNVLLMNEKERRVVAEQQARASELAAAADRAALEEAQKENAVLQKACRYGKVALSQHMLSCFRCLQGTLIFIGFLSFPLEMCCHREPSTSAETRCKTQDNLRAKPAISRRKQSAK